MVNAEPLARPEPERAAGASWGRALPSLLLAAAAYYAAAWFGVLLRFPPERISAFWPATAVLLTMLLHTPTRRWWACFLLCGVAHVAVLVQGGDPWVIGLGFYGSVITQALVSAWAVRRLTPPPHPFGRLRDTLIFIFFAAGVGSFAAAFSGAAVAALVRPEISFWGAWLRWLLSSITVHLTLTPVMLSWFGSGLRPLRRASFARLLEGGLLVLGLTVVAAAVFGGERSGPGDMAALRYAPFPFLLWAAVRFGPRGIYTALFALAIVSTWCAARGQGPFTGLSVAENVRSLQLFLIVIAMPLMLLTAVIQERERTEEALRASEARYRSLFEHCPVALAEYDLSGFRRWLREMERRGQDPGADAAAHPELAVRQAENVRVIDINRAALDLYHAGDIEGFRRGFLQRYRPETYDFILKAMLACADGKLSYESETSTQTIDGRRLEVLAHLAVLPGHEAALDRVLVVTTDLTELRRAERAAAESQRQAILQRMETLSATGRLAAGVAHEINNPLQGIKAQLRLFADDLSPALRDGRRMRLITGEIDRIARIVRLLLNLHREREQSPGATEVATALSHLGQLVSVSLAKAGIQLETAAVPADLVVPMNASDLTQVLLNLVLNAQDAMPQGGQLLLSAARVDGAVRVAVRDTGAGIPAEEIPKIFTPFYTTKGPKGTGLGLSTSLALVVAAGGRIEVDSELGRGTQFEIVFPA